MESVPLSGLDMSSKLPWDEYALAPIAGAQSLAVVGITCVIDSPSLPPGTSMWLNWDGSDERVSRVGPWVPGWIRATNDCRNRLVTIVSTIAFDEVRIAFAASPRGASKCEVSEILSREDSEAETVIGIAAVIVWAG